MLPPNEITAVLALGMLSIATWGYRFSIFLKPRTAVEWLLRGVGVTLVSSLLRAMQWDILYPAGLDEFLTLTGPGGWLNAVWNCMQIYAAYCFMRSLHLFIPPTDREDYHWLSSPFYPHWPNWPRIMYWGKPEDDDDKRA